MTKQDIIKELSNRTYLDRNNAHCAVDNIVDIITECLERGENIYIRGLGTLKVVESPERKARDIHRNMVVTVPASHKVRFKASPKLKIRVNG